MKRVAVCLLLMGCVGTAVAQPAERSFRYDLALDIDVRGHVSHVALPDGVPTPFVVPPKQGSGSTFRCKENGVTISPPGSGRLHKATDWTAWHSGPTIEKWKRYKLR